MSLSPDILKQHLEKEKERMFRIAWKMCGNPEDAEEILQETALKALKSWDQFRGDAMISTWLYRIASNTCLSRKRKKTSGLIDSTTLDSLPRNVQNDSLPSMFDWSTDPMASTLNDELRDALDQAILKLPDIFRLVFLMRDVEGMSIDETSKVLDISHSNVKVRLHRARLFLRDELEDFFTGHMGE